MSPGMNGDWRVMTCAGEAHRFVQLGRSAAPQSLVYGGFERQRLRGNDPVNGLADHLLRVEAKHLGGAGAPGFDAPVEAQADDGVTR
jgi:hypothetical protein